MKPVEQTTYSAVSFWQLNAAFSVVLFDCDHDALNIKTTGVSHVVDIDGWGARDVLIKQTSLVACFDCR